MSGDRLPVGFTFEWVIAFRDGLKTAVDERFPELVGRWPVLRAGCAFEAYEVGSTHIALVISDRDQREVLSGPGQPDPLPFEEAVPAGIPSALLHLWLLDRLAVPTSSIVLVIDRALPAPREISDASWNQIRGDWDQQLSIAFTRGLQFMAASPPPAPMREEVEPLRTRLYKKHPSFPEPGNLDARAWRYMSLGKFVDLMARKSLWLSRADRLGDPLEGALGGGNRVRRETESISEVRLAQEIQSGLTARERAYVSCWHLSEHESTAMWGMYGSGGEAVAVRSTFRRIVNSIHGDEDFFAGLVTYRDYASDFVPEDSLFERLMSKRMSFAHEQELRILIYRWEAGAEPEGLRVQVELADLCERVHVAPTSPSWFLEIVGQLAAKFELDCPVVRSDLDEPGVW